jgi:hypothetical protein
MWDIYRTGKSLKSSTLSPKVTMQFAVWESRDYILTDGRNTAGIFFATNSRKAFHFPIEGFFDLWRGECISSSLCLIGGRV